MDNYCDIINHPRPTNHTTTPMSVAARAAQFSPYAALVGHKDIISADENLAAGKINIDQDVTIEYDAGEIQD